MSPLHRASEGGHVGVALLLVEHGADAVAWVECGSGRPYEASRRLIEQDHVEVSWSLVRYGDETAVWDTFKILYIPFLFLNMHEQNARAAQLVASDTAALPLSLPFQSSVSCVNIPQIRTKQWAGEDLH